MAERDPYADLPDNDTAVADDDPYAGLPDAELDVDKPPSAFARGVDAAVDFADGAIREGIKYAKRTGPAAPLVRALDDSVGLTKGMDARQQRNDQARGIEAGTYAQGDVRAGALGSMRKADIEADKKKAKTAPAYKNKQEAVDDAVNMIDEGVDPEKVYQRFAAIGVKPEEIKAEADRRAPMGPPDAALGPVQPEASGTIGQPERGVVARGIDTGVTALERGYKQAQSSGNVLKTQLPGGSPEVASRRIAEANRTTPAYSDDVSAAIEHMSKAKTAGQAIERAAQNPGAFLAVLAESVVASSPSLLAVPVGIVGGPGAGAAAAGATSYAMEFGASVQDYLTDKGMNPRDPRDIHRALTDPALMAEARDFAARRGVPVAAFDALSMGIAGKVLGPVVKKMEAGTLKGGKAIGAVGAATAAEAGIQGAAGATGELAGQYVSGQDYDPFSALAEFGAEFISAPKEIATNILHAARTKGDTPVGGGIEGQPPPGGGAPAGTLADLERIETDDGPAFRTPSGAIVSESQWNDAPPDRQAMWMEPAEGEQALTDVPRETIAPQLDEQAPSPEVRQRAQVEADVYALEQEATRLERESARLRTGGEQTNSETLRLRAISLREHAAKIRAANGVSEQSLTRPGGIKVEEIRGAPAPLEPTERMQELERLAGLTPDPAVKKDLLQRLKAERQAQEQAAKNEATADAYDRAALETEDKALAAELKQKAAKLRTTEKPTARGIQVKELTAEEVEAQPAERRKDAAERKRIDEMSAEELRKELKTSPVTGLPNRRAYDEAPKRAVHTSVDVDSLKWVNDNMGHPAGDEMLRAVGEAVKEAGADGYHLSGDEFVILSDTPDQAAAAMRKIRAILADKVISHTQPDGTVYTKKGIGLSHGSGSSVNEAESKLRQSKAERARRGVRPERGAEPRGVVKETPRPRKEADGARERQLGRVPEGDGRGVSEGQAPEINTTPLWVKRSGLTIDDGPSAAKIRNALAKDRAAVMRAVEQNPDNEAAFMRAVQEIIDEGAQENQGADAGGRRADDVAPARPAVRRAEAGERQPDRQETRSAREETASDVQQDGQPGQPGADLASRSRRQQPRAERDQAAGDLAKVQRDPAQAAIAQNDALFRTKKSTATTVAGIAKDVNPRIRVREVTKIGDERMHSLTMPDGTVAYIWERPQSDGAVYGYRKVGQTYEPITKRPGTDAEALPNRNGDVWVDVSKLKPGMGGVEVYAIAAGLAHNTGQVFIGDPSGITPAAIRRRSEQMLSSALKYGTTAHLAPHPDQLVGTYGVPPLKWEYGNDVANIESLLAVNLGALDIAFPESQSLVYEPATGQFVDAKSGAVVTDSRLAARLADLRHGKSGDRGVAAVQGVGVTTLKRGAVLRALLRESGGQVGGPDGLLARLAGVSGSPSLRGVLYSKGPVWFSPLQRAIEGITTKQASPQQWLNTITALQSKGVKADEIEFSGIKEYLATREGKVARDDVLAFLRDHGVQVSETILGEATDYDAAITALTAEYEQYIKDNNLDFLGSADEHIHDPRLTEEQREWVRDFAERWDKVERRIGSETRYGSYTLPGGKNYRELLITLPTKLDDERNRRLIKGLGEAQVFTDQDADDVLRVTGYTADDGVEPGTTFYAYTPRALDGTTVYMTRDANGRFFVPTPAGGQTFTSHNAAAGYLARWAAEEFDADLGSLNLEWEEATDNMLVADLPSGNIIAISYDSEGGGAALQVLTPEAVDVGDPMRFDTVEQAKDAAERMVENKGQQFTNAFFSTHWDQANIVAHIRFNERTDADGKRVLFVEEIQSDWAQKGRKEGFTRTQDEENKVVYEYRAAEAALASARVSKVDLQAAEQRFLRAKADFVKTPTAPRAPFVQKTEAWTALALKRVIRYAAENGFDSVAWVNGEQSADRYDLSKQVSSIAYRALPNDQYDVWAYRKDSGTRIEIGMHNSARLPDVVGKEIADKIIAGNGMETGTDKHKILRGIDLKVGGEGMRAYYDKIVPNVAKDVLKKLGGGTVTTVPIGDQSNFAPGGFSGFENGQLVHKFESRKSAETWADGAEGREVRANDVVQQSGFDITPQMRELAMQGMPMFSRKPVTQRMGLGEQMASVRAALDGAFGKPLIDALIRNGILRLESSWESKRGLARDPSVKALMSEHDERGAGASIFIDRIRAADAPALLMHEVGEHYGLPRLLGETGYQRIIDGIRRARVRGDAETLAAWELVKRDYTNEDGTMMVPEGSDNFIREVAAAMVEKGVQRGWIREMLDAIRSWLARTFGVDVDKVDGNLLRGLATSALRQSAAGMLPRTSQFTADRAGSAAIDPSSKAFQRWFGKSKVVDENGDPLMVYHGTTGDFDVFNRSRANPESDFGAGFYFSNTPEDVEHNYAGEGPDLTAKLEREMERIQAERYGEEDNGAEPLDKDLAVLARERLGVQHGGASMPVYLKMENPVTVGGPNETYFTYELEYEPLDSFQDDDIADLRERGYDDDEIRRELSDRNNYEPTEAGTLVDFIQALRRVASRYDDGDIDGAITEIIDHGYGEGIKASKLIELLNESQEFSYFTDDEGNLASKEILRRAFEDAGFDGIIDHTVDVKFGSQRRIGRSMRGMQPDTVHYIAFKPTQIKSAIGNRGTYDPNDPSILASRSMSLEADRISPRAPTAVKRTEDPLTQELQPDLETMKRNEAVFLHNLKLLTDSPDIRVDPRATPDQQAEQVIAHFQRNLEWLFDHYREHADRAKLWYVGGNKIAHQFASRFGIEPRQAAGVIAALSPQKDWFQNVSLAERIMSAVYEHPDAAWTPAMDNVLATRDWGKGLSRGDRSRITGKTLREVWGNGTAPELLSAAHWIRAWDEATNPQMARVITPEGDFASEWDVGNTGKPIALRAQGFSAMAKSLRILADGSRESISAVIGANHKVRSFYNNIIAPYSTTGDVTIDTHAVAAAHLLPLGSSSDLVAQTFGGGNVGQPASKSSDLTGLMGNYAFYAEAYRRAAAAKGVLPREMQSVTWEAVRGLFRPEQKVALKRSVATIWERYGRGEIDESQAREETLRVAEGVAAPKWAGSPAGRTEGAQASSYAAQLPGAVAPGRRAAPDSFGDDGRGAGGTEDLAAKSRAVPQAPTNNSNLDEETKAQLLQRKFFDRFNRVRQLQRERRPGIADDKNIVQADTLYYGRAQYEGEELERKFIEPLGEALKEAKAIGLTVRDADDYLMAKHAPERNRVIAARNPNMPDGGSGLTNRQAAQILAKYDATKTAALDKVAQIVYRMNEDRLLRQETSGLISPQMAAALRTQYRNYVPLKTLDEENAVMGVGRGYELRNSGIELAFGRQSKAGSPIAASIMDAARAVIMAEKAKVDRVIWNLANDPDVIDVMTPVDDINAKQHFSRQRMNPTTGQIETVSDSNWRSREDVVKLRIDGEEKYVWVRDDILRDQLRKVASLADPGPVLRGLGKVTSTIGRLLTEFNPAFTLPNAVRDAIGGVIKSNGIERVSPLRVAAGIPAAWKSIIDFKREANTPGGRMYREFQQDGAKTGAYGITDVGDTMHRLERLGAELGYKGKERGITTKLMHGLNDLAKFVGHANEVVEYATRLSLYKEARRVGYSRKQAAVWAKELTVNFNRSGEYGRTMNSIFVFANAALQGLYGAIMFGKSHKVKAALLGLVVLGAITQAFNEAFGGDDEDTGEKNVNTLSEHTLDNNATVLVPGSANGIKIPLPPEFSFLYAMGRRLYRAASQGNYAREAAGIVGATLGSTLPLRAPDASSTPLSVIKALTPTAVSPFMDLAVNEDFRGAPIVPNQWNKDAPQPWPVLARNSTSDVSKAIAQLVHTATGGDTVEPGAAQKALGPFVSPEAMDHVVGFYTGGLGQFALQSKNLARAVAGDEEAVEINRVPIANRFVFTQPVGYVGRRYRELAPDFQYAMARQRDGSSEKVKDEVVAALPAYRSAERQLTPLFKQLRAAGEEGDKARIEELRSQIRSVQSTVLKAYNEARPR